MIIDNEILNEVSHRLRADASKTDLIVHLQQKGYSEQEILNIFELLQEESAPFAADFAAVAERSLHKNFKKLTSGDTQLYIYDNFLAPDFCAYLCNAIHSRDSYSSDNSAENGAESSKHRYYPFSEDLTALDRDITDLFETFAKLPRVSAEVTYGHCTYTGGRVAPYFNFFDASDLLVTGSPEMGGQRTWSMYIFLNDDVIGGDLYFPELKLELQPKAGLVALWNNLDSEGKPNKKTLHGEALVEHGIKFYLTKSYRVYFTP